MSIDQHVQKPETPQEEIPNYPFTIAEHSLEIPAEYTRMSAECPVARVHMPFGGDAYLLTGHEAVVKAWADPQCGVIQMADGDVPRREAGRVVGSGGETPTLFSVSDARHNQTRRLLTQRFSVKAANDLVPFVTEVTNGLVDEMKCQKVCSGLASIESYALSLLSSCEQELSLFNLTSREVSG